MSNLVQQYGNLVSGIMGATLPKPDAKVGDEATILSGRDRHPAKIAGIVIGKKGKIKGYMLQRYRWIIDFDTEGYAKEIKWDEPQHAPSFFKIVSHGKLKGTVKNAYIGRADAFFDRSF